VFAFIRKQPSSRLRNFRCGALFHCQVLCIVTSQTANNCEVVSVVVPVLLAEPNSLRQNLIQITFKNSIHTSKKTQHFTVIKINCLMPFKEMNVVYSESYEKYK
jgi:hypothetical protein